MRRITTAITAAALALSIALGLNAGTAQALTPGYDSAYQFESAFLSLKPADSGTFSVFFANTGSTSWVAGASSQVNLGICAADKVTCNVTSAQASWAVNWLSSTAYATHTKSVVAPGDFSAFTYNVKVPTGTATGTFRFNGDLVRSATGDRIHPEGYYQDSTVTGGAPTPGGGALSVTPAYSANEDNEVSTAIPGNGQHTYTFTTTLTGTLSFGVITSANVVRIADGQYGFCDQNQDSKADGFPSTATQITAVNGVSISPTGVVINQPIPSNGTITITIDSATRNQRQRVIGWQDLNNNAQIDLTAAGDVNCDFPQQSQNNTTVDGAMIISGRKFYFGPQATFGHQFGGTIDAYGKLDCGYAMRHDAANQVLSIGPGAPVGTPAASPTNASTGSLRFNYDANDTFKINGVQVSLATFKNQVTATPTTRTINGIAGVPIGDTIAVDYDPNPAGISTFNICVNKGADAPTDVSAAIGNFDNGTSAEDVRLTFTSPVANSVLTFNVQRATKDANNVAVAVGTCTPGASPNPNGSATTPPSDGTLGNPPNANFSTVGSTSTPGSEETATFTNFDLSNGTYCYRVAVTNPDTGVNSYSNYVFVTITGGAPAATTLTSTLAILSSSGGFANVLDQGDKIEISFSDIGCGTACGVSMAPNATIRVTDSDCGQWTNGVPPANNGVQTACAGGNTNTVADIICGTNATCTANTLNNQTNADLLITMTGNPTIVAAGSVAGAQYSVLITDSTGITDLAGNAWSLPASPDRVFGPQGN